MSFRFVTRRAMPKVVPTGGAVPSVGELVVPDAPRGVVSGGYVRGVGGGFRGGRPILHPGPDSGRACLRTSLVRSIILFIYKYQI